MILVSKLAVIKSRHAKEAYYGQLLIPMTFTTAFFEQLIKAMQNFLKFFCANGYRLKQ